MSWTWGELRWHTAAAPAAAADSNRLPDCESSTGSNSANTSARPLVAAQDEYRLVVYSNRIADKRWQLHNHDVVATELADLLAHKPAGPARLALHIRSQFPGWVHFVQSAELTLHWQPQVNHPEFVPALPARRRQWSLTQTLQPVLASIAGMRY